MNDTHHRFVASQYGPRAADYVASAVHAAGQDLDRIEAIVRDRPGGRVLDLGCGGGHVAYRVAPHAAEVVAVDLSAQMLETVAHTAAERGLGNIVVRQGAAERLPLADACFDFVLSRFSAHHWHDLEAGLREARRVLAPRGRAVFVDVVTPAGSLLDSHLQTMELLRDASHVRDYSVAEWTAALARAGFAVGSISTHRLRLDFASWIARARTPELHMQAIRSLQATAPAEIREYFAIADDGSFFVDVASLEAEAG